MQNTLTISTAWLIVVLDVVTTWGGSRGMEHSHRPIRLLLNTQLIRRVDEVLSSGVGGFASREELMEEALNSYLLELRDIGHFPPQPVRPVQSADVQQHETNLGRVQGRDERVLGNISSPMQGFAATGDEVFIEEVPMLGLHNRDWPSFWALSRLAHASIRGPVPFLAFLEAVTEEAWELAASLREELGSNAKAATQMLPTNVFKKQAADAGFQNFAVGSLSNKPFQRGLHKAAGPLPTWGAIAFHRGDGENQVSLTRQGWELLRIVDGLGPEQPHNRQVAKDFLSYLQSNAPSDWWGFKIMLREVSSAPTRDALLASMRAARDWSASIASSATQGYIARCREWGLVEPKLIGGTYQLTKFGEETVHNV